jgi:hypothetical protein
MVTIFNSLSFLYLDYTFIIVNCKKKKEEKFFGENFTTVNLAVHLAQDLLQPAILAVFGQNLPFWQSALPAVLAGSNRSDWVIQPLFVGVGLFPPFRV